MHKDQKQASNQHLLDRFWPLGDKLASIESLKQSIEDNPEGSNGGEQQYHLAKLYLKLYQEEGIAKEDTSYAMLAHKYFQDAKTRGKTDIKEKYLQPIKDLAKMQYDKGLQIFAEKSETKFLDKSAAFLKSSLAFGGLPEGTVEYTLARVYCEWDKKDLAYDHFIKAQKAGKKLNISDEKFIADFLDQNPKLKAERKAKELYEQSKLLFYDKKDRVKAFEMMNESIRLDEGEGGNKQYNLAKMYLEAYNIDGLPLQDTTYALLAFEWFQKAIANGRPVEQEKYMKPFRDLGAHYLKKGLDVYAKKEEDYLVEGCLCLKKSLDFGGSPDDIGKAEYFLFQLYRERGEKAIAYEYLQKSLMAFPGRELTKTDQEFIDVMEAKREPDYPLIRHHNNEPSFSEAKNLAEQYEIRAKKLIADKDYHAAIAVLKESIRIHDASGGEKQYILAKLYLAIFLLEGKEKEDYTYAILANDWVQKAKELGKKSINERSFQPLREAALTLFEKGLLVYSDKNQVGHLEQAAEYLHVSLKLGGVPGGEAEYALSKVILESGNEQAANEFKKMAILNGKVIEVVADEGNPVQIIKIHIEAMKAKILETKKYLTELKEANDTSISKDEYRSLFSFLTQNADTSALMNDLDDLEDIYMLKKSDKNHLECHIDALTTLGVPPKVLLDMALQFDNVSSKSDVKKLFWMRKLGGFNRLDI